MLDVFSLSKTVKPNPDSRNHKPEFAFVYFMDFENCDEIYRMQAFFPSDPLLFIKFVPSERFSRRGFGAGAMTYFSCGPPIRPLITGMCVGRL